jgi:hypothetical protein
MKTSNIKKITVLFSVLLLFINLTAQTSDSATKRKAMCDQIMKMYKYVFEGKVVSSKVIRVKADKDYYKDANSYIVQVRKVIKGDIKKGTIEIIQYIPGNVYDKYGKILEVLESEDGGGNDFPNEGIYFSYKDGNIKDSGVANTNSKFLEFDGAIPLSKGELVKQKRGVSEYFSTLSDFYNYLSANYGVKIEDK